MKTGLFIALAAFTACNIFADKEVKPLRDPFWPIGYTPPPPVSETPVEKPKALPKVEKPKPPPPPKPVTAEDWKMARKMLKITGYALADKTDEADNTKTSIVIINRSHYNEGDKLKIISNEIEFIWKVGDIRNNSVDLIQESATRLNNKSSDNKSPSRELIIPSIDGMIK